MAWEERPRLTRSKPAGFHVPTIRSSTRRLTQSSRPSFSRIRPRAGSRRSSPSLRRPFPTPSEAVHRARRASRPRRWFQLRPDSPDFHIEAEQDRRLDALLHNPRQDRTAATPAGSRPEGWWCATSEVGESHLDAERTLSRPVYRKSKPRCRHGRPCSTNVWRNWRAGCEAASRHRLRSTARPRSARRCYASRGGSGSRRCVLSSDPVRRRGAGELGLPVVRRGEPRGGMPSLRDRLVCIGRRHDGDPRSRVRLHGLSLRSPRPLGPPPPCPT